MVLAEEAGEAGDLSIDHGQGTMIASKNKYLKEYYYYLLLFMLLYSRLWTISRGTTEIHPIGYTKLESMVHNDTPTDIVMKLSTGHSGLKELLSEKEREMGPGKYLL